MATGTAEGSTQTVETSEPFYFIVGPEKRRFMMHSALAAKQSRALRVLVQVQFKEATERSAVLDAVDEATFQSFWKFAYTGDYPAPKDYLPRVDDPALGQESECVQTAPAEIIATETIPTEPFPEDTIQEDTSQAKKDTEKERKRKPRVSKRSIAWKNFVTLQGQNQWVGTPCQHPTGLLLYHARIYTFADCYGITGLMEEDGHSLLGPGITYA